MLQIWRISSLMYSLLLFTEIPSIIYIKKMVNLTVLRNVVLPSSKIIRCFENWPLIFTRHKMASMCAKFHCHIISCLENTRVWRFCPSPPPNKIYYHRYPKLNRVKRKQFNILQTFQEVQEFYIAVLLKMIQP